MSINHLHHKNANIKDSTSFIIVSTITQSLNYIGSQNVSHKLTFQRRCDLYVTLKKSHWTWHGSVKLNAESGKVFLKSPPGRKHHASVQIMAMVDCKPKSPIKTWRGHEKRFMFPVRACYKRPELSQVRTWSEVPTLVGWKKVQLRFWPFWRPRDLDTMSGSQKPAQKCKVPWTLFIM